MAFSSGTASVSWSAVPGCFPHSGLRCPPHSRFTLPWLPFPARIPVLCPAPLCPTAPGSRRRRPGSQLPQALPGSPFPPTRGAPGSFRPPFLGPLLSSPFLPDSRVSLLPPPSTPPFPVSSRASVCLPIPVSRRLQFPSGAHFPPSSRGCPFPPVPFPVPVPFPGSLSPFPVPVPFPVPIPVLVSPHTAPTEPLPGRRAAGRGRCAPVKAPCPPSLPARAAVDTPCPQRVLSVSPALGWTPRRYHLSGWTRRNTPRAFFALTSARAQPEVRAMLSTEPAPWASPLRAGQRS